MHAILATVGTDGDVFPHIGLDGPPPHSRHPWDEAFYVMRSEVAFGIGDCESLAVAGTLVQVPGGTTHCFRCGRGGGEMLTLTSGEGASAFFTDVDRNVSPGTPIRATSSPSPGAMGCASHARRVNFRPRGLAAWWRVRPDQAVALDRAGQDAGARTRHWGVAV
jgi:hypothetical protein